MGVRIHGQRQAQEFVLQVYQLVDLAQATTACVPHSLVGSGLQHADRRLWSLKEVP
jgi:hypothetical protein